MGEFLRDMLSSLLPTVIVIVSVLAARRFVSNYRGRKERVHDDRSDHLRIVARSGRRRPTRRSA